MPDWLAKTRVPGTMTHILEKEEITLVEEPEKKDNNESVAEDDQDLLYDKHGRVIKESK